MKESKDEYVKRLHCGHVSFDELANWYYRLEKQNAKLKRVCKRLLKWSRIYDANHSLWDNMIECSEDIRYTEKILKEKL